MQCGNRNDRMFYALIHQTKDSEFDNKEKKIPIIHKHT
jgi:hypothetical protein